MQPGEVFAGRYVIESRVGGGGMGEVWRATDRVTGRVVALKVLPAAFASDQVARQRFLRESSIVSRFDHRNIIVVHDVGESDDGTLYLTMRLMPGGDLNGLLLGHGGTLDLGRAVEVVGDVARGLDVAHRAGLVHRDVKPGNVLFDAEGTAVICDFGLAKPLDGRSDLTSAGAVVGTAAYMAPEQVTRSALSGATDVYALGCLLFRCLAGAPPFVRASPLLTALARTTGPAPSLELTRPDLPAAVVAAVAEALQKEPGDRFTSAGDFAAVLARAAAPRTGSRSGVLPPTEVEAVTSPLLPWDSDRQDERAAARRPPRGVLVACASVVVTATLVGAGFGLAAGRPEATAVAAEVGAEALDPADQRLEALLPDEVFGSCVADTRAGGNVASLKCASAVPGVVDELLVRRFADDGTMAASFDRGTQDYPLLPCSDFAGGTPGSGHRSTWGPEDADLACFVNSLGDAVVRWEHPSQRVHLFAVDLGDDSPGVYAWWKAHGQAPLTAP